MPSLDVPVLQYHGLWTDPRQWRGRSPAERRYWLAAQDFAAQVRHLAACGYTAVTLSDALAHRTDSTLVKPIVLTFDDGWASDWRIATPILRQLGWKAEFFVTVAWLGTAGFMTWEEARSVATAGMNIQSHSLTHPDLGRLPTAALRYELEASKAILEERIGRPVEFFALPGGSGRPREIARLARAAGYRGVCTSEVGLNAVARDLFCWRRIPVVHSTALSQLETWVQGKGLTALAWRRRAFRVARRLCGEAVYEKVKEHLLRALPAANTPDNSLLQL